MDDLPDILNTRQACQVLGVDRVTLWRWVKEGRITPIPQHTARRKPPLRFRKADVVRLLNKDTQQ